MSLTKTRHAPTVAVLALCILRAWFAAALPLRANGKATLDDHLFMKIATNILAGRWFGAYDHEILSVGPFYPVFVAIAHKLHVPLILGQQLLYVGACVALYVALRSVLPGPKWRLPFFVLLLFGPFSFDYDATRIVRDNVYLTLSVLTLAAFFSLLGSAGRGAFRQLPHAIAAGAALSALWLTSEEGPWIAPTLAIVLALSLVRARRCARVRGAVLAVHSAPIVLCALAVFAAAFHNYLRYDVFHVVDLRDRDFEAANGALLRVRHPEFNQFAQVPREVRERIYPVSPTFAILQPYFESRYGYRWGEIAEANLSGGVGDPRDIRGRWFMRALRRGASDYGYYRTAARSRAFYGQIAAEVNQACADGRLDCGPKRASTLDPWREEYVPLLARAAKKAAWRIVTLDALHYPVERVNPYNHLDDYDAAAFRDLAGTRLLSDDAATFASTGRKPYHGRLEALRLILDVYPYLMAPLCVGGALAFVWNLVRDLRLRTICTSTIVCAALLAGIASRIAILSYLAVTSFDALEPRYLLSLFPMTILTCILALREAVATSNRVHIEALKQESHA